MTKTKKKLIITCVTLIVTILSFFYSTLAYFTDSKASRYNGITAGSASVQIIDVTYPYGSSTAVPPDTAMRIMPGYEISKTLTAKNTGTLPLFIRVQLHSDITLAENARGREAEIDFSLVSFNINTDSWEWHDGYYYYRAPLSGGTEAVPLFTKIIFSEEMGNLYKDSTIKVTTRIEVVQANNNADYAWEAYGWTSVSSEGGDAE